MTFFSSGKITMAQIELTLKN
uniref:Uncharacterized protein n=1 Tax=Arundo donax TaxID=35708 RepID=A0A0A9ARU7_ARUDO